MEFSRPEYWGGEPIRSPADFPDLGIKLRSLALQADSLATALSVQFSSATQSRLTLCDPMDCSTPGFLVHHQHPKLAQIHVHLVSNAIQTFHPF